MTAGARGFSGISRSLLIVVALAALVGGCSKKKDAEPTPTGGAAPVNAPVEQKRVQVTKVELGTQLSDDKRVKSPATSFAPKDTIFASVVTEGAGAAATEIVAKWTFQDGQVVNETKRAIAPAAVAVTEFSIQKPNGWPTGEYKVEISLDGKAVETKAFRIQ